MMREVICPSVTSAGRAIIALLAGGLALAAAIGARAEPPGVPRPASSPTHAIAMHGEPALPADFDHLPYADPQAPKGGRLTLGFEGTFDSLNPFNLKAGSTSQGLIGNVFQSADGALGDEPFTLYGLIAQSIETDAHARM